MQIMEDRPEVQPLLTPEQTAKLLNITERKLGELLRSGELAGIKVGREWRIDYADLEKYIRERRSKA